MTESLWPVIRDAKAQDLIQRLNCNLPSIRIGSMELSEWKEDAARLGMPISEYVRVLARIGRSLLK